MRVYRADYYTADGSFMVWAASRRAAAAALREAVANSHTAESTAVPSTIRPVEVPTTRAALVDWLNRNFNSDNG